MALSHSPRKLVPLSIGDDKPSRSPVPSLTKRVFFCGVVVENQAHGRELPEDVQELIASLGDPLELDSEASPMQSASESTTDLSETATGPHARKRAMTDTSVLSDIINELVTTERSYVKRLRTLKADYADPLRTFSRNKDTAIIPPYEAKILFGNIDHILPVNEAFLEDLEKMIDPDHSGAIGGVGDVALKHFRDLRGFENYRQYYAKREEAQGIFEREMRKASGFAAFIDRIKYSSADSKNRVGLRELLMDPVQRIPRYTLMFRMMLKHMAPHDPQRAKLTEADEIASKIALAETDEQTKRAAIMYCLSATVDDFPPALVSNSRQFVDCIDVEDILTDGPSTVGSSAAGGGGNAASGNLHCSLFLFDDKLMIVKRPGNGEKGGRALSGLNDLDKLTKAGGLPLGMKKSGMICKGIVDITDVVVTDVGGADIHLYLEVPPQDQMDRWAGRPFRALSVVHPPSPINLDPKRTEADKSRFLENLWAVQARYRTRLGQSVILCAEEREVENRGGKVTRARTYFNVYQRTAFLKEVRKTKVVVHIDPLGSADPIPFGIRGPPYVVIRVQPMAGELSRYTVTSSDPNDEAEEDIVQSARVPGRIVQTIHQFGLFKFRTGNSSMPSTPTASTRSRAAIFGLDAISRNLFSALPGSSKGDIFGGSVNAHRRSKTSSTSRSSVYTQSTGTTADSSLTRFSSRNSTVTTATTMSSMEDDRSVSMSMVSGTGNSRKRSRSFSKAIQLIKGGKSPGRERAGSDPESFSPSRISSRLSQSTSDLSRPSGDFSDVEDDDATILRRTRTMDESERDLTARLELARKNSRNQHETQFPPLSLERPTEDTIYEEGPSQPARPSSRASRDLPEVPRDTQSQRSTTPQPEPTTPIESTDPRRSRSASLPTSNQRPTGPRSPSPLPPRTPRADIADLMAMDVDLEYDHTLVNTTQFPVTPRRNESVFSPFPRSKRQPFDTTANVDVTPKPITTAPSAAANADDGSKQGGKGIVEPLSIKKKTSVRSNDGSPVAGRRLHNMNRSSPLMAKTSSYTTPPPIKTSRIPMPSSSAQTTSNEDFETVLNLAETTREDLESARRAVKRIKLDVDQLRGSTGSTGPSSPSGSEVERPESPFKALRAPQRTLSPVKTREAQQRMEEMLMAIGRRNGETSTPRARPNSLVSEGPLPRSGDPHTPRARPKSLVSDGSVPRVGDSPQLRDASRSIEDLAAQADASLSKAIKSHEVLQSELRTFNDSMQQNSAELEKTRVELQNAKRQCEVMKSLVQDCTLEKEIMYEAFNEELDGMYNDANLPEDEAWAAITRDLRQTKESRNALAKENSNLKRRLAEMEMQQEEWGALLRAQGLIS